MADSVEMKADVNVEFDEASSRQQINSGESVKVLFGKLKKFLTDLKAVAFSGEYGDLIDTPDLSQYASKEKYGDTTIDVGRKDGTTVGHRSTAEGQDTTASNACAHAEGSVTIASGVCSHAEGVGTIAGGAYSHAEGSDTTASGVCSHAGGRFTKALNDNEVAYGIYNVSTKRTLFSIGDGNSENARHNAFEITKTGGKLHDKEIATTDMSLKANGGNADTVDGMHASDFMPINGEVRKYGVIRMNGSDGIRARHIDGNDTEADGALYLNYNSPNAPIYMNGGNTAIHSGNIGSQSVNYANSAGNADTVGEKSADDFSQIINLGDNQTDTKNAIGSWGKTTIYRCTNWTDFPAESPDSQGIVISMSYAGTGTAGTDPMWVTQFFIPAHSGVVYKRHIDNTDVRSWKEISTTPIKSVQVGGTTDVYSNLLLWTVTDNRKPIFVEINGYYAYPFLTADANYYYYYAGIVNAASHESAPNTAISGTVYYIEI